MLFQGLNETHPLPPFRIFTAAGGTGLAVVTNVVIREITRTGVQGFALLDWGK